jgi:putative membrane protein (TIGR04086 family)
MSGGFYMMISSNEQSKSNQANISLISLIKAVIISFIITIPLFAIFSLILSNTDYPQKLISPVVVIITVISIFVAASFSTVGLKSKGWLNGSLVGLIYMIILYLVSSLAFGNFEINRNTITLVIIGIVTGAIGGIVGINLRVRPHKKSKRKLIQKRS